MFRLIALTVFFVLLSGCAATVMVSAQRDLTYQLDKEVPVFLELGNDISVKDKNTYAQLQIALAESGFKVVQKLDDSQVVLTFGIFDEQYLTQYYDPAPYYWGRRHFYGSPFRHHTLPQFILSDAKGLKLRLFDTADFRSGKRLPLWEGVVSADPGVFAVRLHECLQVLIDTIGQDYQGRLRLPGK